MSITKIKHKGFTLVELLIAVSLLAILTGVLLAVINPKGIQAKARDSQRVSDLVKVKVALEGYFADYGRYPVYDSSWGIVSVILKTSRPSPNAPLSPTYINVLPVDPKTNGSTCETSGWRDYFYKSDASGSQYVLAANMEISSSAQSCPVSTICSTPCNNSITSYYTTTD